VHPRNARTPERLLARVRNAAQLGGKDQLDAIAALQQLVAEYPKDDRLWNTLAQALIAANDYQGALEAARMVVTHNPSNPTPGYINAGIASRELGDILAASAFFGRALARAPHDPLIQFQCAKTFRAAGETGSAARAYVEAIAYAAEERDDIVALAIAGLGGLEPHPLLPTHLRTLIDTARAVSERRCAPARLHLQRIIARTPDAITRDAALTMLSFLWRNRERTTGERPS